MKPDVPSVCILISDFDGEGGMQQQTRRLSEALAAAGGGVCIVTRNYYGLPREERRGSITIRRTPAAAAPDSRAVSGPPPVASRAALTSLLFLACGFVWCVARRRSYDVIQCQQMFGSMLLGMALRFCIGKRVVVRVTLSGERGEVSQLRRMPLAELRLWLMRRVDHWVALTAEMSDELQSLGIPASRIAIIPNAAPLPARSATDASMRKEASRAIEATPGRLLVYAGRLSAEKGVDTLLRAMPAILARHPDATLAILGGGGPFSADETALRELAEALGVSAAVRFEGFVSDVTPWLLAADVFVLPSRSEGMSNALIEAMAAGAPIVTTGIAAHHEVVRGGENALVIPAGDAVALGEAINALLEDEELSRRLGQNARESAAKKHSPAVMLDAYVSVYRAVSGREDRLRATGRR